MTPKEFVKLFYNEKTDYFNECFNEQSGLAVAKKIKSLNLNSEQSDIMKNLVDDILSDIFYTILLGIDGEASIGKSQISYKLFDEEENELTESGEIESEAWKQFQQKQDE